MSDCVFVSTGAHWDGLYAKMRCHMPFSEDELAVDVGLCAELGPSTKRTATLVTIIIAATVALLVCLSLLRWRKKIFSKNYQNDDYVQHYKG